MLPSTAKIISICKKNYEGPEWLEDCDTIEAIELYIGFYTGMSINYVNVKDVKAFLRDAVLDFVSSESTKDKTAFINNIYSCIDSGYDECHAYISAFRRIKVRDKGEYINGFSDDNTKKVDLLNGNL